MVFLKLWREDVGSSQVAMVTTWNFSCCLREVRPPFELRGAHQGSGRSLQGNRVSSRVVTGNPGSF